MTYVYTFYGCCSPCVFEGRLLVLVPLRASAPRDVCSPGALTAHCVIGPPLTLHLSVPASVENGEHCDFTILRNMLIR